MAAEQGKNKILCSTITLPLNWLFLPIEATVDVAINECGYDGITLRTPRESFEPRLGPFHASIPAFAAGRRLSQGLISDEAKKAIRQAEQSYRGESNLWQSVRHHNRILATASFFIMDHRLRSLHQLERLQKLVGDIPVTLYPARDPHEEAMHERLANKRMQPSIELIKKAKISSFKGLVAVFRDPSKYKMTLDLGHYSLLADYIELPPDEEGMEELIPFIGDIQYPGSRTDIGPRNQETDQTMQDLLTGSDKSQATRRLLILKRLGYQGPVTPEFSPLAGGLIAQKKAVNNLRILLAA